VQVVKVELDSGAVRRARKPEVEILAVLAGLEEEDHVARVEIGKRVEQKVVTGSLLLGVELGFFVSVREECAEISHQVSVTAGAAKLRWSVK
jgi:hypothetical protein